MIRRTLRESISLEAGNDGSRHTISPQRQKALKAEQRKLSHFFQLDQLLNFSSNLSGIESEDYDQQTSWFFYFIDIIFVATIFNISHFITKCGDDTEVYVVAASYFTIMFSTRMFFDTFTSILHASGVLHTLIFILYGLGIYCMTVNIAAVADGPSLGQICQIIIVFGDDYSGSADDLIYMDSITPPFAHPSSANTTTSNSPSFGRCHQAQEFDFGFAASFLFTRCLIFVLFVLYCTVFHQVHQQKGSPGKKERGTPDPHGTPQDRSKHSNGNDYHTKSADIELPTRSSDSSKANGTTSGERPGFNRTHSTARAATEAAAQAAHQAHVRKVLIWKIVPLALSCTAMLFVFGGYPISVVLPVVAAIEVAGDVLPELVLTSMRGLQPDRHNLEERLGK
jgi:hypothetical protein